ncbi:inclusion body family protein [Xenorhabdus japonica]|uniref:Inclusion body protein n=1 Tax=Xenorhabdus japonica TaxID=53341 RepID=A0A1I5EMV6_9GAMM|nr:inclusion body family protein [Xenorhabdus japonica]SFO12799.1 Inclusion body protein [Xenorhabdus japonica]
MSNVIDILVAVDAQSIMEQYGRISTNINAPTYLGCRSDDIHMLARPKYVISGQGGSELKIDAKNGDVIRWRGATLSKDAEYSAALLKIVPLSRRASEFFTAPVVKPIHSYVPVLKSDDTIVNPDLLDVDLQSTVNYHWETMVKSMPPPHSASTEFYTFIVGIYSNGNFRGFVYWDPAIVLDNK